MKFTWVIEPNDLVEVKTLLDRYKDDYFVTKRRELNLQDCKSKVRKADFWKQMVACHLTSVQRSGPTNPVARFLRTSPFQLAYKTCLKQSDVEAFMNAVLTHFGGIRRTNIIPREMAGNLRSLESGMWQHTFSALDKLRSGPANIATEREVANFIRVNFKGFGPKQSRNLLQSLGLTRYEIPIDSRITDWLTKLGFPFPLPSQALGDLAYYLFVMDRIQELCKACDVVPCILDAAIFTSVDKGAWNKSNFV